MRVPHRQVGTIAVGRCTKNRTPLRLRRVYTAVYPVRLTGIYQSLVEVFITRSASSPVLRAFDVEPDTLRPLRIAVCPEIAHKLTDLCCGGLGTGWARKQVRISNFDACIVSVDNGCADGFVNLSNRLVPTRYDVLYSTTLHAAGCARGTKIYTIQ